MLDSVIHLAYEALGVIALMLTIGEKLVRVGRRASSVLKKVSEAASSATSHHLVTLFKNCLMLSAALQAKKVSLYALRIIALKKALSVTNSVTSLAFLRFESY
jgi:hypothetical protein